MVVRERRSARLKIVEAEKIKLERQKKRATRNQQKTPDPPVSTKPDVKKKADPKPKRIAPKSVKNVPEKKHATRGRGRPRKSNQEAMEQSVPRTGNTTKTASQIDNKIRNQAPTRPTTNVSVPRSSEILPEPEESVPQLQEEQTLQIPQDGALPRVKEEVEEVIGTPVQAGFDFLGQQYEHANNLPLPEDDDEDAWEVNDGAQDQLLNPILDPVGNYDANYADQIEYAPVGQFDPNQQTEIPQNQEDPNQQYDPDDQYYPDDQFENQVFPDQDQYGQVPHEQFVDQYDNTEEPYSEDDENELYDENGQHNPIQTNVGNEDPIPILDQFGQQVTIPFPDPNFQEGDIIAEQQIYQIPNAQLVNVATLNAGVHTLTAKNLLWVPNWMLPSAPVVQPQLFEPLSEEEAPVSFLQWAIDHIDNGPPEFIRNRTINLKIEWPNQILQPKFELMENDLYKTTIAYFLDPLDDRYEYRLTRVPR